MCQFCLFVSFFCFLVCLSVYFICLSVNLPFILTFCLSIFCLSAWLSVCVSMCRYICFSICLFVCVSVCLSVYHSICFLNSNFAKTSSTLLTIKVSRSTIIRCKPLCMKTKADLPIKKNYNFRHHHHHKPNLNIFFYCFRVNL